MAQRVNLDAMIPREDFGLAKEGDEEFVLDLFDKFPIANLSIESPILKLIRKPDFQRETNHWSPEQLATFIASFLDNEVIPSLILWKSQNFIFVIDGGHRLSALRAWMEDDYGDRSISRDFYEGQISDVQKKSALRARKLIEQKIGRFSTLKGLVDGKGGGIQEKRANRLFTRGLQVQWVQGNASVAESSFFKINSQGTPLDETEESLIRNRKKPIAIGARAILRSGTGNKYWSTFDETQQVEVEKLSRNIYDLLFEPQFETPIKTLDLPLGGTVSPVDALTVLIEFLTISNAEIKIEKEKTKGKGKTKTESDKVKIKSISDYDDDSDGKSTINTLSKALKILNRITGNSPGSLGLHPAVYFYNERGKHSRYIFLAMITLISDKLENNDSGFFKKFTLARAKVEKFLLDHKFAINVSLTNMSKNQRVQNMKNLFNYLINSISSGNEASLELAMASMGLQGRVLEVISTNSSVPFPDDVKSMAFIEKQLEKTITCEICKGVLDPSKSVSYDHKVRVEDGGKGSKDNIQLVHPYCNTAMKG